uniref:RRM domain-containing protein n=1 Tax=Parascaris univalens TaxID=6257 RepID=A0A915B4E2_PARUN
MGAGFNGDSSIAIPHDVFVVFFKFLRQSYMKEFSLDTESGDRDRVMSNPDAVSNSTLHDTNVVPTGDEQTRDDARRKDPSTFSPQGPVVSGQVLQSEVPQALVQLPMGFLMNASSITQQRKWENGFTMHEDYMPYEPISATRAAQLTFSEAAAGVPSVQSNLSSGNMRMTNETGDRHAEGEKKYSSPFGCIMQQEEIYSRKIFIGGVPTDVTQDTVRATFSKFGELFIDWPKPSNGSTLKRGGDCPLGYLFIIYMEERSVRKLMSSCYQMDGKAYLLMSSQTVKQKPVEVRPWRLSDIKYEPYSDLQIDTLRTVFIGAMPRPTRAEELADVLSGLFGPVCYACIHVDPELRYPKGAARVTFATEAGFISALKAKFVHLPHAGALKRVEIKPYVVEGMMCDQCRGARYSEHCTVTFCAHLSCLQYFCNICWYYHHRTSRRLLSHRPFVHTAQRAPITYSFEGSKKNAVSGTQDGPFYYTSADTLKL